jgi:hypothetical protein
MYPTTNQMVRTTPAAVAASLSGQTMNINGSSASCTGNAATATLATKASTLSQSGGNGTAMTFNWSGQSGQPTWLWGSNDGSNIYVWNPSNFSVNYANTAGSAPANGGTSAACSGNAATVTNGVYTSAFPNSLAANGYQKVQGGTIIQWGVVTTAALGTSTVTLPIAFPSACQSVTIGNVATSSAGSGGSFGYASILSASQIKITNDYATTNNSTTYYWIAIGY